MVGAPAHGFGTARAAFPGQERLARGHPMSCGARGGVGISVDLRRWHVEAAQPAQMTERAATARERLGGGLARSSREGQPQPPGHRYRPPSACAAGSPSISRVGSWKQARARQTVWHERRPYVSDVDSGLARSNRDSQPVPPGERTGSRGPMRGTGRHRPPPVLRAAPAAAHRVDARRLRADLGRHRRDAALRGRARVLGRAAPGARRPHRPALRHRQRRRRASSRRRSWCCSAGGARSASRRSPTWC